MGKGSWLDVVQAGAVIVASLVALYGINSWRREYVGKRRMELAEEVLAMFYEAKDALHDVRAPFSFHGEGSSRVPGPNESPERKKNLDYAYVTFERLKAASELFSRLFGARYRFMAAFGRRAGVPFYELNRLIHELRTMASYHGEHLNTPEIMLQTQEQIEHHQKEGRRIRRVLFSIHGEQDEFASKIDEVINEVDRTCRAVIQGHGSTKYLLLDRLTLRRPK